MVLCECFHCRMLSSFFSSVYIVLTLPNTSLIVAGSETSATLLSGCIFYLCTAPHVMSQLVAEVRSTFKQDSYMTFRAVEELKYMTAVIEESLRIYPPFVTSLSRIVPQGGAVVNGHFLPEDVCIGFNSLFYGWSLRTNPDQTAVACHHYASYHSESNFAFPDKFMPERWLGSDPIFADDKKDVLQPFSLGPRVCLGKQCVSSMYTHCTISLNTNVFSLGIV